MMNFTRQQPQQTLGDANNAHLCALAQQGNAGLSHAALMEQATAQQQMQAVAGERNLKFQKSTSILHATPTHTRLVVRTSSKHTNC